MAKLISKGQVEFFRFDLTRGDSKKKKNTLQDLCGLYRGGLIFSAEQVATFETLINGIVLQQNQDLKVVRWCLNALAQFGRLESSRIYVETALARHSSDPEIQAAGVAALCRMYRGSVRDIDAQHMNKAMEMGMMKSKKM